MYIFTKRVAMVIIQWKSISKPLLSLQQVLIFARLLIEIINSLENFSVSLLYKIQNI